MTDQAVQALAQTLHDAGVRYMIYRVERNLTSIPLAMEAMSRFNPRAFVEKIRALAFFKANHAAIEAGIMGDEIVAVDGPWPSDPTALFASYDAMMGELEGIIEQTAALEPAKDKVIDTDMLEQAVDFARHLAIRLWSPLLAIAHIPAARRFTQTHKSMFQMTTIFGELIDKRATKENIMASMAAYEEEDVDDGLTMIDMGLRLEDRTLRWWFMLLRKPGLTFSRNASIAMCKPSRVLPSPVPATIISLSGCASVAGCLLGSLSGLCACLNCP